MAAPSRAAPAYVQVFPTLRCNRSCAFCFNRGLGAVPDMGVASFSRLLERLRRAGVEAVDLLGGEPTLHPRLEELVRDLARRGMRATISTNGDAGLGRLAQLEDEMGRGTLRIGVSVNAKRVPARLAEWVARRAPMVKSVCVRGRGIPPLLEEHLARPGAEGYLIFLDAVTPADLARTLSYPEFLERLGELRRRHPGLEGVACGGFVPDLGASPELADARCPAGTTKLSVLPDGSVYPCYLFFGRPELRLGNLLEDPFDEIWRHPSLAFFRTFRGNPCRRGGCAHHTACHGGCPAVSLLVTGDLSAPDPRCVAGDRRGSGTPER